MLLKLDEAAALPFIIRPFSAASPFPAIGFF
jgi:hypothetical protein